MAGSYVKDFFAHFGVRGMRWGVRRDRPSSTDAAVAKTLKKQVRKQGIASLDNKQLKTLNERMQLEQNFSNLKGQKKSVVKRGNSHIKDILGIANSANSVYGLWNSPGGKALSNAVKTAVNDKSK